MMAARQRWGCVQTWGTNRQVINRIANVVTTSIEHPAVLAYLQHMQSQVGTSFVCLSSVSKLLLNMHAGAGCRGCQGAGYAGAGCSGLAGWLALARF